MHERRNIRCHNSKLFMLSRDPGGHRRCINCVFSIMVLFINKLFFSYLSFNSRQAQSSKYLFFLLSSWSYRIVCQPGSSAYRDHHHRNYRPHIDRPAPLFPLSFPCLLQVNLQIHLLNPAILRICSSQHTRTQSVLRRRRNLAKRKTATPVTSSTRADGQKKL